MDLNQVMALKNESLKQSAELLGDTATEGGAHAEKLPGGQIGEGKTSRRKEDFHRKRGRGLGACI